MNSPEISIVLPTQGARASLVPALRSALAQDFAAFEVVVVDDAVSDRGWRERAPVAALLGDARVRVVPFHQSRGCAAAKNAGLRAARGTWVCYLDDDNEYLSAKIGVQHARAGASGSPVVLCGLEIRVHGRRRRRQSDVGEYAGDDLLLRALPDTNVLFHRRDAGVEWNESLGTVDDTCFFHALVARHGVSRVPNVPQPLVIYHAHADARANRDFQRLYRGLRCLVVKSSRAYSPRAQRVVLLRSLLAFGKFRSDGWGVIARRGWQLVRAGGWREWRTVANAAGVKLPFVRRWMVT